VTPQVYADLTAAAVLAGFSFTADTTRLDRLDQSDEAAEAGIAAMQSDDGPLPVEEWWCRAFVRLDGSEQDEADDGEALRLCYLREAGSVPGASGPLYLYYAAEL
ncbi:MAG: hypothetical protein ABWY55_03770, partial [Microbacterium sp.]